jgi:hypothetical protein
VTGGSDIVLCSPSPVGDSARSLSKESSDASVATVSEWRAAKTSCRRGSSVVQELPGGDLGEGSRLGFIAYWNRNQVESGV